MVMFSGSGFRALGQEMQREGGDGFWCLRGKRSVGLHFYLEVLSTAYILLLHAPL